MTRVRLPHEAVASSWSDAQIESICRCTHLCTTLLWCFWITFIYWPSRIDLGPCVQLCLIWRTFPFKFIMAHGCHVLLPDIARNWVLRRQIYPAPLMPHCFNVNDNSCNYKHHAPLAFPSRWCKIEWDSNPWPSNLQAKLLTITPRRC